MAVWYSQARLSSKRPGTTSAWPTPVRFIVSMPSRIFWSSAARTSLSRVTKFLLLKSASRTNGPSFMFRFWISRTMRSWSAGGRPMRPLSNIAVKPSSAANWTWAGEVRAGVGLELAEARGVVEAEAFGAGRGACGRAPARASPAKRGAARAAAVARPAVMKSLRFTSVTSRLSGATAAAEGLQADGSAPPGMGSSLPPTCNRQDQGTREPGETAAAARTHPASVRTVFSHAVIVPDVDPRPAPAACASSSWARRPCCNDHPRP
ncbi:MAG: hypothetical protein MZV64_42890 [Ignavibacteriales bacterium]|nr:hypothetical protein [Ignavibacteriales bacterium]